MIKFRYAFALAVLTISIFAVRGVEAAVQTSQITQYLSGVQVEDGTLLTNKPVSIRATGGKLTYDQGWATYSNSVNDGNDGDIEFTLQKNFSAASTSKRYCINARDLAPYGVKAKIQIWTGEYTILPGYPYGLEVDPHDFVSSAPLTSQFSTVCTAWTPIITPANLTPQHQRLAIIGDVVVKQGAVQIRTVSIESR